MPSRSLDGRAATRLRLSHPLARLRGGPGRLQVPQTFVPWWSGSSPRGLGAPGRSLEFRGNRST